MTENPRWQSTLIQSALCPGRISVGGIRSGDRQLPLGCRSVRVDHCHATVKQIFDGLEPRSSLRPS